MSAALYKHPELGPTLFLGHVVAHSPAPAGPDDGEVTLTIHCPPEGHDAILDLLRDPKLNQFSAESAGSVEWAFQALLVGVEREMPHKGDMAAHLTFIVTGAPTVAPNQDLEEIPQDLEERLARVERTLQRLLDHLSSAARLTA